MYFTHRFASDIENEKQQRDERRISENYDVYAEDDHDDTDNYAYEDNEDIDAQAMNVVVNTSSNGSKVTVRIENGRKDQRMKQERRKKKFPVQNKIKHLEEHNLY